MNTAHIYLALSVVILGVIAVLLAVRRRKPGAKISRLTSLAFVLIVAGMVFGDSRLVGYGLMGTGVLVAIIDMVMKLRTAKIVKSRNQLESGSE